MWQLFEFKKIAIWWQTLNLKLDWDVLCMLLNMLIDSTTSMEEIFPQPDKTVVVL